MIKCVSTRLYEPLTNEIIRSRKILHSILHCRMLGKINISIDLPSFSLIPAGLDQRDLEEFETNLPKLNNREKELFVKELNKKEFTALDSLVGSVNYSHAMVKAVKENFEEANRCLKSVLEKSRSARQGESSNAGRPGSSSRVSLKASLRLPSSRGRRNR